MSNTIVVAEDDRALRESVVRALTLEGYQVSAFSDGLAVLQTLEQKSFDCMVLDLMMPSIDGLTVCRRVRAQDDHTPILIMTARTEITDRVSGLDAGADDYLPKPFALDELLARVRALLRRGSYSNEAEELRLDDLVINVKARRSWRGNRELVLTKTEFDLLELLVRNTGVVMTHDQIYDDIWGYRFGPESKGLTVYVGYLRRKTEEGGEPRLIQTLRGVGYTARLS